MKIPGTYSEENGGCWVQSATRCDQVKLKESEIKMMATENGYNAMYGTQQTKKKRTCDAMTPELLRCKKKITFQSSGNYPAGTSVARRNERERNRVRLVNMGFATLREHVPNGSRNKKMSKVETLKSAVEYIRELQQLLQVEGGGQENRPHLLLSPNSCSISSSPTPSENSDCSSYEDDLLDFTAWFS